MSSSSALHIKLLMNCTEVVFSGCPMLCLPLAVGLCKFVVITRGVDPRVGYSIPLPFQRNATLTLLNQYLVKLRYYAVTENTLLRKTLELAMQTLGIWDNLFLNHLERNV